MAEPMPNISLLALAEMNDRLQADLAAVRAQLETSHEREDVVLVRCEKAQADLAALRAERDRVADELMTVTKQFNVVVKERDQAEAELAEARARLAEIQTAVQQAVTRYAPELDWLQAVCTVGELGTANIK